MINSCKESDLILTGNAQPYNICVFSGFIVMNFRPDVAHASGLLDNTKNNSRVRSEAHPDDVWFHNL